MPRTGLETDDLHRLEMDDLGPHFFLRKPKREVGQGLACTLGIQQPRKMT